MTIRRFIFPVGLLLLAVLLVVWLRVDRDGNTEGEFVEGSSVVPSATESGAESTTSEEVAGDSNVRELGRQEMERREDLVDRVIGALNTPISFYGRVIDQYGEPVADAEVGFLASDRPQGTSYWGKSDAQGYFSISGIKGYNLSVKVNKEGYHYIEDKSNGLFAYASGADGVVFKAPPTKAEPAVFFLHKMGETVQLIKLDKYIKISRNGDPVEVNLQSWDLAESGQGNIKVEAWTYDEDRKIKERYNWRCKISVPGGGLVERIGEFNFEAPEDGYQPYMEISMSADAERWTHRVEKSYFLKLPDRRYSRITFEMFAGGDHFFRLESYLNPEPGNRNLEADTDKLIEIRPR